MLPASSRRARRSPRVLSGSANSFHRPDKWVLAAGGGVMRPRSSQTWGPGRRFLPTTRCPHAASLDIDWGEGGRGLISQTPSPSGAAAPLQGPMYFCPFGKNGFGSHE